MDAFLGRSGCTFAKATDPSTTERTQQSAIGTHILRVGRLRPTRLCVSELRERKTQRVRTDWGSLLRERNMHELGMLS